MEHLLVEDCNRRKEASMFVSIVVWHLLFCAVASYISTTTFLILHLPLLKFHSHVARENFQHTGFLASKDKN